MFQTPLYCTQFARYASLGFGARAAGNATARFCRGRRRGSLLLALGGRLRQLGARLSVSSDER